MRMAWGNSLAMKSWLCVTSRKESGKVNLSGSWHRSVEQLVALYAQLRRTCAERD